MTDLMNTSTHYPTNPNEVLGNRRPARPSSAQLRSTTPTRNRPQHNTSNANGMNTTAKLEQSLARHDLDRTHASATAHKSNGKGKSRLYSTWTPLQDEEANHRLFDERKQLVNKWFENWSDDQRRMMLEDLMAQSRPRQLTYTRNLLSKKFPAHHQDFTRAFPRVLCLYIFSFLDPRSLCRCAQVCWYWKFLSETDQIWMPKCLRFGWTPKQSATAYESTVWKRVYSFNIQALQTMPVREYSQRSQSGYYDEPLSSRQQTARSTSFRHAPSSPSTHRRVEHPPWRANSRNPSDTLRYNYLENNDMVLDSVMAKHRKHGTSLLHQTTDSDQDLKSPGKEVQTRGRADERFDQSGRKRRSQSLSARGSPSVSFRDEHNTPHQHHQQLFSRPASHRPVDIPRPPSSALKSKSSLKNFSNHHESYLDE